MITAAKQRRLSRPGRRIFRLCPGNAGAPAWHRGRRPVTGADVNPHTTQSETFVRLIQITQRNRRRLQRFTSVFANPINISGASVSTDGGNTFTRLTKSTGQSPFSNTYGDPVILYNRPTGTWFTVWLDAGCGGLAWAGISPPIPRIPIAGPITVFTTTRPMTASLAGPITIQRARSTDTCTFLGTTSLLGVLKVRSSTDNGVTWVTKKR